MSSARINRGFHRLGIFLAAVPFLVGVISLPFALYSVKQKHQENAALICAQTKLPETGPFSTMQTRYALQTIGCSKQTRMASREEILAAKPLNFWADEGLDMSVRAIAIAIAIYIPVVGLGWVVSGFSRDK